MRFETGNIHEFGYGGAVATSGNIDLRDGAATLLIVNIPNPPGNAKPGDVIKIPGFEELSHPQPGETLLVFKDVDAIDVTIERLFVLRKKKREHDADAV